MDHQSECQLWENGADIHTYYSLALSLLFGVQSFCDIFCTRNQMTFDANVKWWAMDDR